MSKSQAQKARTVTAAPVVTAPEAVTVEVTTEVTTEVTAEEPAEIPEAPRFTTTVEDAPDVVAPPVPLVREPTPLFAPPTPTKSALPAGLSRLSARTAAEMRAGREAISAHIAPASEE